MISIATAKTHVSRALRKVDARDRAQLVALAYETGLVHPRRDGLLPGAAWQLDPALRAEREEDGGRHISGGAPSAELAAEERAAQHGDLGHGGADERAPVSGDLVLEVVM